MRLQKQKIKKPEELVDELYIIRDHLLDVGHKQMAGRAFKCLEYLRGKFY